MEGRGAWVSFSIVVVSSVSVDLSGSSVASVTISVKLSEGSSVVLPTSDVISVFSTVSPFVSLGVLSSPPGVVHPAIAESRRHNTINRQTNFFICRNLLCCKLPFRLIKSKQCNKPTRKTTWSKEHYIVIINYNLLVDRCQCTTYRISVRF